MGSGRSAVAALGLLVAGVSTSCGGQAATDDTLPPLGTVNGSGSRPVVSTTTTPLPTTTIDLSFLAGLTSVEAPTPTTAWVFVVPPSVPKTTLPPVADTVAETEIEVAETFTTAEVVIDTTAPAEPPPTDPAPEPPAETLPTG